MVENKKRERRSSGSRVRRGSDQDANSLSIMGILDRYGNEDEATRLFEEEKWAEAGAVCPKCKGGNVYRTESDKALPHYCRSCRRQFSVTSGTALSGTHLPMHKWLLAIYLIMTSSKGISSPQLALWLGCRQPTAWLIIQRIRKAIAQHYERMAESGDGHGFMIGIVEADETYIGGGLRSMHADKRREMGYNSHANKTTAMGIKERLTGRIWPKVIERANRATLHKEIRRVVRPGSTIHTDQHSAYMGLEGDYAHESVNHSKGEFVRDDVTTNGIESFWSEVKRALMGVFHDTSDEHLAGLLWELAHRRSIGGRQMDAMEGVRSVVRCLLEAPKTTYKEIVGKDKRRRNGHG